MTPFKFKAGDFLFSKGSVSVSEQAISQSYRSADQSYSHVALFLDTDQCVVEAHPEEGVRTLEVRAFLEREHEKNVTLDVARLASAYQARIKNALNKVPKYLGKPYNHAFSTSTQSLYCSQLMHVLFQGASEEESPFEEHPMSFKDIRTGLYLPYWEQHFKSLDQMIPEGVLGSHPQSLSESACLEWVCRDLDMISFESPSTFD